MHAVVGGIRTLDFMDHFASAERCGSGIHEIRKFPFCCGCVGYALIEFALVWQDVRLGNFLLFLGLPHGKKNTRIRMDPGIFYAKGGIRTHGRLLAEHTISSRAP